MGSDQRTQDPTIQDGPITNTGGSAAGHSKGGTTRNRSEAGGPETGIKIVSPEGSRVPDVVPEPKRKPGRPPGSTKKEAPAAGDISRKPAGKAHDKEQTAIMVQVMLSTGFNIVSMRGGEHWRLSNQEAQALAEPIAAIMERHNLTQTTGKYGDYIALVVAIGMVIVPKVIVSFEIAKQNRPGVNKNVSVSSVQPQQPPSAGKAANADPSANAGSHQQLPGSNTVPFGHSTKSHVAAITG